MVGPPPKARACLTTVEQWHTRGQSPPAARLCRDYKNRTGLAKYMLSIGVLAVDCKLSVGP